MTKNIVLVGFMGTGKTAVSKLLAKELSREYVSIDETIEKREGKAIKDIFKEKGEAFFRSAERAVVKELSGKTGIVIDAGGGVVLDNGNMEDLKKNGTIVCLWADARVIYQRTKAHSHRPLLNVADPLKKITEILDKRGPFYRNADFHIDTTSLEIGEVVREIIKITGDTDAKGI